MRYTQRDCEGAVIRLAVALKVAVLCHGKEMAERARYCGAKVATYVKDKDGNVGASRDCVRLDYNPTYGGAVVEFTFKGHTGTWQPFGSTRLRPFEFVQAVYYATSAMDFRRWRRVFDDRRKVKP